MEDTFKDSLVQFLKVINPLLSDIEWADNNIRPIDEVMRTKVNVSLSGE